jgi:hypothetical protein
MKRSNPILAAALKRLERNLDDLKFCCSPGLTPKGSEAIRFANFRFSRLAPGVSDKDSYWPPYALLREIEDDVIVLAEHGRQKQIFPRWKAFEQLDRGTPRLRLKMRVDKLVRRAGDMLPPSESTLDGVVRLAIAGTTQAQCSLRDIVMSPQKLAELLQDDRQMERQRCMARPVAKWIVWIAHPMAEDFVSLAEFYPYGQHEREFHRRLLQSLSVRRHRLTKKTSSKSVTVA